MTNSCTENSRCSEFLSEVQHGTQHASSILHHLYMIDFGCDNCKNVRVWFSDCDGEKDETKEDTRNEEFTVLNAEQGES